MSRIEVRNSCIIVHDYEMGESPKIERVFSIYDIISHKRYPKGLYYDEETKDLYLPGGIDVWWVKKALDYDGRFDRVYHHKFRQIDNIMMKAAPKDEKQMEALRFMFGIEEYADIENVLSRCLTIKTGGGKTYISIATIAYMKITSIVITGSGTLLNQWKSEILSFTNLKDEDVYRISGSDVCLALLNGSLPKANKAKIYLCTHGTIRSFGDHYGWDKVYELFEKLGIGIKIIDECHTNIDNMYMIDFFTNVCYTYYVTATLNRSNKEENKIFEISLKNVPKIDLFDPESDPHTHYFALKFNSRPNPSDISRCKNKYGLDMNAYTNYVTLKPEFYQLLRIITEDYILKVLENGGKTLIYIHTNDGILRVYKWLADNYPELIGRIGIFTSLVDKEQKLIEREYDIILTTIKSCGAGEDIRGLKLTIVLAEPFKSNVLARQTLGRTRDDGTLYIEVVDLGFKQIRRFYQSKIPVFNTYALDTSSYTLDYIELVNRDKLIKEKRNKGKENAIQVFKLQDDRFDFDKVLPRKEEPANLPKKVFIPLDN